MSKKMVMGGGSRRRRLSLFFLLLLSWFFSCATSPHLKEPQSLHVIKNVPFFPQEAYQCGPASLAGVLKYWGVPVTPEEIATEIYSPSAKGTLTLDMILYAEKKGLEAHKYRGSLEDIKDKIDSGLPIIVLVDYGIWVVRQNHFMVVVGYDENDIIANSGKEPLKVISGKDLVKAWKKTEFWTLLVTPKR